MRWTDVSHDMDADYSVIGQEDVEQERFPESGIAHRKLTEALGCTEMRVNALTLDPGEAVAYHRHECQEEVYVLLDGPGRLVVDGEVVSVPKHGVVRVAAELPRKLTNDSGSESASWLMFGAPPVGTVEDFGEYVVVDEEQTSQ